MAKKTSPSSKPRLYWDACIWLDYVDAEPGRVEILEALLDECENKRIEIWTSQLSVTEVAFGASEKKQSALSDEVLQAIDELWHPDSPVIVVEVHEIILRRARELIRAGVGQGRSGLKSADAIHLATALHYQIPVFNTRDSRIAKLSDRVEGITIKHPTTEGLIVFPSPSSATDDE